MIYREEERLAFEKFLTTVAQDHPDILLTEEEEELMQMAWNAGRKYTIKVYVESAKQTFKKGIQTY